MGTGPARSVATGHTVPRESGTRTRPLETHKDDVVVLLLGGQVDGKVVALVSQAAIA